MSTSIRVDVALARLLERLRVQQNASRQGLLQAQARRGLGGQLLDIVTQQRTIRTQQVQRIESDSRRIIVRDKLAATRPRRGDGNDIIRYYVDVDCTGSFNLAGGTLVTLDYAIKGWKEPPLFPLFPIDPDACLPVVGSGTTSTVFFRAPINGYKVVLYGPKKLKCKPGGQGSKLWQAFDIYLMDGCRGYYYTGASAGLGAYAKLTFNLAFQPADDLGRPITSPPVGTTVNCDEYKRDPCYRDIATSETPPAQQRDPETGLFYVDFTNWP